jgi:acyl-CoA thioester hydrolase
MHKTIIPIRFADMDQLGHVNNANYLTYMETARVSYFKDVVGAGVNWTEKGIILARAEVNFIMPINLEHEEVHVLTHCSHLGTKSFELTQSILIPNGEEVASGSTTLVCFDYVNSQSIPIPAEWKTKFK